MVHRASLLVLMLILFATGVAFGQKERFQYEPRHMQLGLRVGNVNAGLNLEYRVTKRVMASVDAGVNYVTLQTHFYNRFNRDEANYDEDYGSFLNLGWEWWAFYTSLQLKGIFGSNSHFKYNAAPYANTFFYYGLQLKYNGPQYHDWSHDFTMAHFRETYRMALLFGRQAELGRSGRAILDLYLGAAVFANYKLSEATPKALVGIRFGYNVWRKNT